MTFLRAAREITAGGRTVLLYRAGRTAEGAKASASHTASIAGDYAVTRELARAAGVVVADSLSDFEELVRLFTFLRGKRVEGTRLGAISNAGFECVAFADNLGRFSLPAFDEATGARLEATYRRGADRLGGGRAQPHRPHPDDRGRGVRGGRARGHGGRATWTSASWGASR